MGFRKFLIYATVVGACSFLAAAAVRETPKPSSSAEAIAMDPSFPTLGSAEAPVEVLLIEDFKCKHCRSFSETFIPRLMKEYVAPGKVRFTLLPLAFLKGSKQLANAALEVYDLAPDRYIPFVLELFRRSHLDKAGASAESLLIEIAQKVGGIQMTQFRECVRTRCHDDDLERNFEWSKQLMGEDFGTPALYLNGEYIPPSQYTKLWKQMDRVIQKAEPK